MKQLSFCLFIFLSFINHNLFAQSTNKGKDFWVGYGLHQFMDPASGTNTQNMTLYLSVESLPVGIPYATVTITIDSSGLNPSLWWKRVLHINANTVMDISNGVTPAFNFSPASALGYGPMPKGATDASVSHTAPTYDCRLYSSPCPAGNGSFGLFRKKGIHITSDVDIAAYSHIYGSVSSGATMLLPTNVWGKSYTTINSAQGSAAGANGFFYVIANEDATRIKITASAAARSSTGCVGTIPSVGVPFYVDLQKGQIYQYVGQADAAGNGVDLTSSNIESVPNAAGIIKKIAVFAGSGRTSGETGGGCTASSRDNDMQQCFPQHTWGKQYATVPFSTANSATSITPAAFAGTVYKIIAKDSGTNVIINGTPITIPASGIYKFTNAIPNYIESNKPIAVAQFMTSGNCGSALGDPEMIYLTPLENAVSKVGFYRNTREAINVNYLSIVVADTAYISIDGALANSTSVSDNVYVTTHPNLSGYKIIVKGWSAANAQCLISSNAPLTAITYGLGGAESYGYSCGAKFDSINLNYNIMGKVISPLLKPITNADIAIKGIGSFTQKSDSTGYYNLLLSEANQSIIRPNKNNDIKKNNGVTAIDIILTQRHILNTNKLNSPYKIIAADVSNDKTVSNIDVILMKRLILGIDTTFTGKRLWAFVDSAYQFPDTSNPFPYKDSIKITNLTSDKSNQTFIGVKLGDVNYDWNAALARGVATKPLELIVDKLRIKNDELQIPVSVKNFKDLTAIQYTLHFNNDLYEFVEISNNKLGIEYNAKQANQNGSISFLWTDGKGEEKTLEDDSEIFTLVLKRKWGMGNSEGQIRNMKLEINNAIAEIEAWDKDNLQHKIILTKRETKNEKQETKNEWSVYPNPAKMLVTIASKGIKTIIVTDYLGRIKQQFNNVSAHQILNTKTWNKGLYIIQAIKTNGEINTTKLIIE